MTTTTILHEAEVELWEAVEYYETRSPDSDSISKSRSKRLYTQSPNRLTDGLFETTEHEDT